MEKNSEPTLYLVATPIGNLDEFSKRAIETLSSVDVIAAEDTRNTIKLLTHFDIHTRMITYHNFNEEESTRGIMSLLNEGKSVALVSDAGYPLISDPGFLLTQSVIREGYRIVPVSGPNAGINALVASGLETVHYMFYGFLNAKSSAARKELEALKDFPYTIIFYEAPHRIEKTIALVYEVFGDRKAVIARELTKLHEEFIRGNLSELAKMKDFKGEIVFLVEGKKESEEEPDYEELLKEVARLVREGLKTKSACNEIAEKYKVSKNELYNRFIKTKQ